MARKTMAERYAMQRSNKAVRRRSSLPRLSGTATAVHDRAQEAIAGDERAASGTVATFTAGATSATALPRRAGTSGREKPVAAGLPRVDYTYVKRDLRRIAITAVAMLVLLIALNIVVEQFVH